MFQLLTDKIFPPQRTNSPFSMDKLLSHSNLISLLLLHSFLQLISLAYAQNRYFINCGSNTSTTVDTRTFVGDSVNSSFSLSATPDIHVKDQNASRSSSPLYQTARIFKSPSSYDFNINSSGTTLLVRFHFFPFSTPEYDLATAYFDVSVTGVSLLSNFSVRRSNDLPMMKEYFFSNNSGKFSIYFAPSQNSFAFVNAIEVISAREILFQDEAPAPLFISPAGRDEYKGLVTQVLLKVYRVNVGGPEIPPRNDSLWRNWTSDGNFLFNKAAAIPKFSSEPLQNHGRVTQEIAPDHVYLTCQEMNKIDHAATNIFNITWNFNVRSGVNHLVRMHFCDIVSELDGQLDFNIYIDGYYGKEIKLSELTPATPYYIDFVVKSTDSGKMNISVGPLNQDGNAILNGLEIMEIRKVTEGSLHNKSKNHVVVLIASVIGGFAFICTLIVAFLLVLKCKKPKPVDTVHFQKKPVDTVAWSPIPVHGGSSYSRFSEGTTDASPLPNINLGLKISFADIQLATNNFDEKLFIAVGGFGKVYKGVLKNNMKVAVKRGELLGSDQGLPEFQTEIMVFSKVRHRHLVSLIGYCDERSEMILVYEYMEKGTLRSHLYGSNLPCLSWRQRLQICIGSARGLHYLHTSSLGGIIHRDVKSTNILLDENYVAKVADFGLSKLGPSLDQTHVSTSVKGSFGYLDPEYFRRQKLTEKSDVYSFGVVLLEVLCARPALDTLLPSDQVNLAEWGMQWQKKGQIEQIIDPLLVGKINPNCLRKFGEIAEKCLSEYGVHRPTMGDVAWDLEYALQLQETAVHREAHEDSTNCAVSELPLRTVLRVPSASMPFEKNEIPLNNDGGPDTTANQVFSQLMIDDGR